MKSLRRRNLRVALAWSALLAFVATFVLPGAPPQAPVQAAARPVEGPVRRFLHPAEMKAILGAAPGMPERWMAADRASPFSVLRGDQNVATAIPVVGWRARGGMAVSLVLFHNSHETLPPNWFYSPPPYPLGWRWTHSYNLSISTDGSGNATVREGDGRQHFFTRNADGSYTRPAGVFETLVQQMGGGWLLTRHDQTRLTFASDGKLLSIADRHNNTISLAYNGSGQLATVTDPTGRQLVFSYSGSMLVSVTDPLNRVWTLQFAGSPSQLDRLNDPAPATTYQQFTYTGAACIGMARDRRGYVWTYAYDQGKLTGVTNPQARTRGYLYFINQVQVTDEDTNQVTYHLGGGGQLQMISQSIGYGQPLNESFTYDGDYNRLTHTRPGGGIFESTFDTRGNVLTIEDPLTRTDPAVVKWTFTYNIANQQTTARDALGNQTTRAFNAANGDLNQEQDPTGRLKSHTYDSYGQRLTSVDANNKLWQWGYDTHGNGVTTKDPYLNTTTTTHNILGWPLWSQDAAGRRKDFLYDTLGWLTRSTHAGDGAYREFTRNANGQVVLIRDENGKLTAAEFDSVGNCIRVTDANGHATLFGFSWTGRRTSMTNPRGKTTSWTLDALYRPTLVTYPDGTTEQFTYTADSQVATHTDGRGYSTGHQYDLAGRLTLRDYPTGIDTSILYLANDRPSQVIDRTGTTAWTYTARGETASLTSPQGNLQFLYDGIGSLVSRTHSGFGTTSNGWDDAGRLASVTNRFLEVTAFTNDGIGRATQQLNANGTKALYFFTGPRGFLTAIEHRKSDNSLLARYEYTRDLIGSITLMNCVGDFAVAYGYDHTYQLLSETRTGNGAYSLGYSYDPAGNRLTRTLNGQTATATYGDNNQLLTFGGISYAHDGNGNRTGQTEAGLTRSYSWGYDNELTGITYPGGATNSFSTNSAGVRVAKTDTGGTRNYLFAGNQLVYDGQAEYTIGGPGGLITERRAGATNWYHTDFLQSTRGLTNAAQTATASLDYDAWGNPVNVTGSPATAFRHKGGQGYERDADSGLLLLGRRYYDPLAGRFLSRDPIGYGGKDPNLYRYANNNPVSASDPAGLWLDTVVDFIGLIFDVAEFVGDPSLENGGMLLLSVGAMVIPGVMSPSMVRRLSRGMDRLRGSRSTPPISCFPAGTPVLMADGSEKPIERVRPGDRVHTADEWSAERRSGQVTRTYARDADHLLTIRTKDGRKIEATPEHPFWVEGKGFVTARRLARSDLLTDAEGRTAAIAGVTARRGRFRVYNLEVARTHTYFAGEAAWWVHNDCTDDAVDAYRRFGDGSIWRYEPPGGLRGPSGENWPFHDVYRRGDDIYDRMRHGDDPVPFDDWRQGWGDQWTGGYFDEWSEMDYWYYPRHTDHTRGIDPPGGVPGHDWKPY